jgi:hypothetical protein
MDIPRLVNTDDEWEKFVSIGMYGCWFAKEKLEMLFEYFPCVRGWVVDRKISHAKLGWLIHTSRETVTRHIHDVEGFER